ncbi:glycosyltransferase family 2 protein [Mucilaginibacter sp.]|uniref:glycosyltransferase family 2 protein n=1 Tax=Mucilaginibacter sp. TaxID=1882438 RepID=UPI0025FE7132|nr:glycosyltransferase family 2 protein [Mucilaginibacter sp.]
MEKSNLMDNTPLISICIPAYNCEKYIGDTISCFLSQTYKNIEIIVVNDGSNDGTKAVVNNIKDERVVLINVGNGGAAKARNIAYNKARGEYIVFFDADDYVQPDFIWHQLNRIRDKKDVIVLSAWGRFYHDDISTFQLNKLPDTDMTFEEWIKLYWYNCTPMTNPGRAIIPKSILEQAGLWNENLSLNDDLEFFTRIFLSAEKIVFNNAAILYYRSGIEGLSSKKGSAAYTSLYKSILLSTEMVVKRYNSSLIKQSCANFLQCFIYDVYPDEKELIGYAEKKIIEYGGANFPFPSGAYTKFLASILGWKITKSIKKLIQ